MTGTVVPLDVAVVPPLDTVVLSAIVAPSVVGVPLDVGVASVDVGEVVSLDVEVVSVDAVGVVSLDVEVVSVDVVELVTVDADLRAPSCLHFTPVGHTAE